MGTFFPVIFTNIPTRNRNTECLKNILRSHETNSPFITAKKHDRENRKYYKYRKHWALK